MNHKQKLGYTFLGVMATLIGIGVGSILSPPLVAQRNGVFDEVQCNKLTVVDRWGKAAINLYAVEQGNGILVSNIGGEPAFFLLAGEDENSVTVANKVGNPAVRLIASKEEGSRISVVDNAGEEAVLLHGGETGNGVFVRETAISLFANKFLGNSVMIGDTASNKSWAAP